MKIRNNKKLIIYGLIIALAVTTVAYAALQTVLIINGTVTKKGGSWNIYFTNISTPTLTGKAEMDTPTLNSATNLSFSATLYQPLDKAVFTVDVVNGGSYDAIISAVNLNTSGSSGDIDNISYSATYADGTPINNGDTLVSKQTRTIKVTVMYDEINIDGSYNWDEGTLNLDLTLIYTQGNGTGSGGGTIVDSSNASAPNLLNNSLTPVIYDETANSGTGSWVIADTSTQWYDYSEQKWANAVILNSGVSTTPGTLIDVETQAKAMYVWIPRYEYKIEGTYGTHTDGTAGTQALPGEIEVKFISSNQTTADSGYRIHPAFTWDNNDNGSISANEHITGIWVGKFATTGSVNSPTILPNSQIISGEEAVKEFAMSQLFGTNLSNSTNIDAHMMKNSEWGAVAYLSQSTYGKYGNSMYTGTNKEVYVSPFGSAGNSYGTPGTDYSNSCEYNDITDRGNGTGSCGGGASTTGNIYGIYGMAGPGIDVMGYLTIANSNYATDPNGYFGWGNTMNGSGFTSKPADKYFDNYSTTTSTTACAGGICYGHALSETAGWYNDDQPSAGKQTFITVSSPWMVRGCNMYTSIGGGMFSFIQNSGGYFSSMSVLVSTSSQSSETVTYEYEYKLVTDASYGEWSSWSTTSITETSTLDVETKTEYEWVGTEISDEEPSVTDEEYTASEITYSCPYDFTYLIEAPSHPSSIDGYVCTNASSADNETCKYYVYSDGICGYSPTTSDPCPNGGDFWTVGDKKYCVILTYYCIYGTFNDDYGYCEVDVYDNVTYYRYRTINSLGSTEIQWSSSDNDESLLSQGYELTGNKRIAATS